jgi:radical SAM protein with 4Fe4S-binding SPASM domain
MEDRLQQFVSSFVESTREFVFVRPEDKLLILRPNRVHYLNNTAVTILHALYNQKQVDVASLAAQMAARYRVPEGRIVQDLDKLLHSLSLILQDKIPCAPAVKTTSLRPDLPELIAYAKRRGLRANLITNGLRCADESYVASLAEAGLNSAQVSLEAGDAATHDAVVAHAGAFEKTVQGVRNLKAAGIHTHTNTTINGRNRHALPALVDFLVDMGQEYLSMNMVIRTGGAVGVPDIRYDEIGEVVLPLKQHAEERGIRFVWYSPVPYCLFNSVAHGLGSQSCAAADGLLSIAPDGQVLPCSSFEEGIGSLLKEEFASIWNRREARYWRNKDFLPPGCKGCELVDLCCGACPLYWDEQGTFAEIASHVNGTTTWQRLLWRIKRRFIGRVKGVGLGRN